MTILETFIKLRDDIKLWVTNNLNQKANISYVDEKFDSIQEFDPTEIQEAIDANTTAIDTKVDKVDGMGLSTNDYTAAEKDKLSTVEANANFYEHPVHTSHSSGLYKITIDESGHVSGATLVEKPDIVALGIPEQDTTYEEEISDLSDRIDDVENNINITNEELEGITQDFESYKTTNNEAVSTNASGIEANKTAIEAIQGDYLTSTDKNQLEDEIEKVSEKVTANASAIEILNGEGNGSVKQSIDNAFNEFAANVTNDDVVNTYKELIDYAATHGPEFTELVGKVDTIDKHVGEVETDLSNYKTAVSDQFTEVDTTINNHINDTNNPHAVTKEQIGLDMVDNTADIEKPISNAMQEALDEKADLEHEHNDLYYTKDEILESITVEDIDDICEFTSGEGVDLVSAATEEWVRNNYQTKGDYATETYVNNKIAAIPTPDVSGQINTHNISKSAHSDIRQLISDTIDEFTIKIEEAGSIDIDLGGDGDNVGEPNPINADTLGGKLASEYATNNFVNERVRNAAPRNLLDNSDFRNPVNQRGQTSYTGDVYGIDRWKGLSSATVINVLDGYIEVAGDSLIQYFDGTESGTYVAFVKYAYGVVAPVVTYYNAYLKCRYVVLPPAPYLWVAVYEGEYTIDTLPEYQPKGYGVELAECQRYYRHEMVLPAYQVSGSLYMLSHVCELRDMGMYAPSITLIKFTKPDVVDITSFASDDSIGIEIMGNGKYLLSRAYLSSCSAYDLGMLRFNISADL